MPTLIKLLTGEGLHDVPYTAESLADAARYEPNNGIYTVTNTYDGVRVLKMDAHFDRMEDSARRQQIPLNLNRQQVRDALRQMIETAQFGNVRFRVTVPSATPDQFILTMEPFVGPTAALIEKGVRCITAPNSARRAAQAKTTDWMHARQKLQDAQPEGIYDTFLLDADGYLMEGLSANVYAIIGGELRTAGEGVLKGISQQIVFAVAPPIIAIRSEAVHINELPQFDEMFLTSSSRGIIPVTELNGTPIGTGQPGETTRALREAYDAWVIDHLEPL